MRRRDLLRSVAVLSISSTAGCAFTDVPEETILTGLSVTNRTERRRAVDVLVTRYDDVVAWETVDLDATDEADIPLDVSDDPGDFHVYVRAGERRAGHDVSPRQDADCVFLDCVVENDEFRFTTGSDEC